MYTLCVQDNLCVCVVSVYKTICKCRHPLCTAVYLTTLLAVSTLSVISAGLVLNIHHRDPRHPVPSSLKYLFDRSGHPSSWTRRSTLKKTFSNNSEASEFTSPPETGSLAPSGHSEHLKELQVVCETKVKVKENGEHDVQLRSMGGGGGGGGQRRRGGGSNSHVPPECRRLMREPEIVRAPELTWHEIGKSLDSILFWIFFIITNTVTTIILLMFVGW